MHIYKRMSSIDISENQRIEEVLNLENGLSNENREKEIRKFLLEKVVFNIQKVNTEKDLLNELNRLQNLNSIPMVVKRYFALEE